MTSTSEPDRRRQNPARPVEDPGASEVRRQIRVRRLPPDAACVFCGETEISVLLQAKVPIHLLEGHHAATKSVDKLLLVTLCLNHHALVTALQQDVGALPHGAPKSCLEALDLAMRSLGSFFELMAEFCYLWAGKLAQVIIVLDSEVPGWRTLPGMP